MVVDAGNALVRTKGWSTHPDAKELARRKARADLILRFYEKMGAAALGLGPEDLALGWRTLKELIAAHPRLTILSANLATDKGRKLLPGSTLVDTPLGKIGFVAAGLPYHPKWRKKLQPWEETPKGLKWLEPAKVLPPLVQDLRKKGAKLVVLLAAMSRQDVQRVVRSVPGLDFVLMAGHGFWSNRALSQGRTFIVGMPPGGKHIAALELHVVDGTFEFVDRSGIPTLKQRIRLMLSNWRRYEDLARKTKGKVRERYLQRVANLRRTVSRQLERLLAEARTDQKAPSSFFVHRVVGLDAKVGEDPRIQAMVDEVKKAYGIDDTKRRVRPILPPNKATLLRRNMPKIREAMQLHGLQGPRPRPRQVRPSPKRPRAR